MKADLLTCIILGSFGAGTVGFLGGFLGPIIFMPDANQGPMLGIFITGPLGFVLGAAGGFIYWLFARKKRWEKPR
jgi:hypothetical protein